MKTVALLVGILALLLGLLWIGQGTGYVHWPATSVMISVIKWAYYGACFVVVGLILIWYSRR